MHQNSEKMNFVDIQVNGFVGVDFNSENITADDLHFACEKLLEHDTARILVTIITDDIPAMCRKLSNITSLRQRDEIAKQVIAGFHIEGPFINETPGYRGAHRADAVVPANLDGMKHLLDAAGGLAKLVTLAPERDKNYELTRMLGDSGVTVSAGHCNPTLDQLKGAVDAGLKLFTHTGNGCPMKVDRHDNIIQRAISLAGDIKLCFIADGAHIPLFALKNYIKAAGVENSIIVTDAMCAAGLGPGEYKIGYWNVSVGEDRVARSPDGSHLVGAVVTMGESYDNLLKTGLSPADARTLLVDNPASIL